MKWDSDILANLFTVYTNLFVMIERSRAGVKHACLSFSEEVDRKSMYLLGALYPFEGSFFPSSSNSRPKTHNIPSPVFVQLRSPSVPQPQPGDPIRWRLLPMDLVDAPILDVDGRSSSLIPSVNVLDQPLKALSLTLQRVGR